MASMFHKPIKKELSAAVERKPRTRPRPRPPAKPDAEPEEESAKPPSGTFTDYQLISSSRRGWKYDVMKFDSRGKEVDPTKWTAPVKLNRKDYRPSEGDAGDEPAIPIDLKPMLGPDGKPVVGVDGKVVLVGPDGKVPQANGAGGKFGGKDAKGKGKGKMPFKKKTKQVFLVPEETRQLRREERYPWVMEEGGDSGQVWVGHIENPEKALTHALLVPFGNQFQFVPAHRWYKFQKRPNYRILALEEAEAEYAKLQKNKDPERWLMRKKAANGKGPSDATLATLKAQSEDPGFSGGSSAAADGSTLKTVDSGGGDLFGDDDDEEGKMERKRRDKEMGGEGDLDEMEYEDDFADDEGQVEVDGDDEEAKEMEERLKREYRNANKLRDSRVDEDEEEDDDELTGAGKDLKKLVKKTDKNEAYESDDDDKDPYASEEDEPEDTTIPPTALDGPAVLNQSQPQPASGTAAPARPSGSQPPRPPKAKNKNLQQQRTASKGPSRANSPGLGNAVVAKRATSPKAPKQKAIASGSRAGSPLASGSRAASPVPPTGAAASGTGSRGGSPGTSRAGSPSPAKNLKRKATDDAPTPSGSGSASASATGAPTVDGAKPKKKIKRAEGPLEESMVIAFLREKKDATTKDCILKFQPYVKDEETKKAFTAMVKKVAIFKKSALQLRPEYQ